MQLLKSLEILNAGGIKGGFRIDFRAGVTAIRGRNSWIEGDSNGVGKTTILNGVSVALYGRTPEGATKFELIHRECENARYAVELGDLSVVRTYTASGERLEFTHLGLLHSSIAPNKKDYRIKQVQDELNKYLGVDFHTFCNSIYVGPSSKTIKFLEAEPAERAKMLAVLVNSTVFETASKLIKDDITEREKLVTEIAQKIEFCEERDSEVDDDIENLQQSLDEMNERNKKRELYVNKEKSRIKREFEKAKKALNATPSQDMEALNKERSSLLAHIKKRDREKYSAEVQYKKLGAFDETSKCPLCTQPITEEHKKSVHFIKETLQERMESWSIDLENATTELAEIEQLMEECREEHRAKVNAQKEIEALRREMITLKDQTLKPNDGPIKSMLSEKKEYKENNLDQLKSLKLQKKTNKTRLEYLKKARGWLGTDIRNFMFDSIRSSLAIYANEYLGILGGGRFTLEFPVNEAREKFDITIYKNNIEAPRSTLSGGEKWRVKIALVLAFRCILMENTQTKHGMFLLDDDLGVVDAKGFEKFHELVEKNKAHLLPQVIATVPKDSLIYGADQILTVTRGLNERVDIEYEASI